MKTLAERLKLAMAGPPKVRAADLARACGVTPPSVSDWLSGKTKTIEGENLMNAAKALNVHPWWLASGRGDMRPAGQEGLVAPATPPGMLVVPLFDARASMGPGYTQPEYDTVIEHIAVSPTWVREALPSLTSQKNLALLPASGDSMEGTFNDGDLLWVDRGVNEVKIDAVYVLSLRDELYVKRLQRRPDGSILMISDNKKYEPYLIDNGEREKFRVLGRVVYAWRGGRL